MCICRCVKAKLTVRGDHDFRCLDFLGNQDGEVLDVRGIVPQLVFYR